MSVDLLVSAEWLASHLGDPGVRPVDVRWYLTEPGRGRAESICGALRNHAPRVAIPSPSDPLSGPEGREAFAAAARNPA